MGSRHSGLTLAAGSGWTVINHYWNKADSAAAVLAFGHAWYANSLWRFKVHGALVPDYQPNPFKNQFATLMNPRTVLMLIPPQEKFEVEAKNSDTKDHVYESVLEYHGEPDASAVEGEEVTTEPAVQQSGLITTTEYFDVYPAVDSVYKLGDRLTPKRWLELAAINAYLGTLKQNLACDAGITIDGVDISSLIFHKAKAYRTTAQSIPTNTYTAVSFTNEEFDTDSIFDLSFPSRLTCKTAGYYLIYFLVNFDSNATGRRYATLYKNAAPISLVEVVPNSTAYTSMPFTTMLNLAVNDYLEVFVFQNSGAALNLYAAGLSMFFGMVKI